MPDRSGTKGLGTGGPRRRLPKGKRTTGQEFSLGSPLEEMGKVPEQWTPGQQIGEEILRRWMQKNADQLKMGEMDRLGDILREVPEVIEGDAAELDAQGNPLSLPLRENFEWLSLPGYTGPPLRVGSEEARSHFRQIRENQERMRRSQILSRKIKAARPDPDAPKVVRRFVKKAPVQSQLPTRRATPPTYTSSRDAPKVLRNR